MGWKIVRDRNQEKLGNHISGQWRTSPDAVGALTKKLGEEYGEFAEHRDPAELYDLIDVIHELLNLLDEEGAAEHEHNIKTAHIGFFNQHQEWHPNPKLTWEDLGRDERT
jgi:predicted house-cleaning noncanonical NTP pyrophosphatase (MazG superfamily)